MNRVSLQAGEAARPAERRKTRWVSAVAGNASSLSLEQASADFRCLLADNETIRAAYKEVRDYVLFTGKRLILVDVQGITGKKIRVQSIPYRSVTRFAVETTGPFDVNAELTIWLSGEQVPVKKIFYQDVNIYEVQAVLTDAVSG